MRAEQVLGFVTTVMIVCTLSLAVTVPLIIWPLSTSDGVVDSKTHLLSWWSWPGGADWYAAWLGSDALAVVHWVEVIMLVLSIYNALKAPSSAWWCIPTSPSIRRTLSQSCTVCLIPTLLVGDHLQRSGDADNAVLRNHVALRPHLPPGMPSACRRICPDASRWDQGLTSLPA